MYPAAGEPGSSPFLHRCLLTVWTAGPSICRWLICSVYRGAVVCVWVGGGGGGGCLMKRAEKRLPPCGPRSLLGKPALAVKQHKCPICVCLPMEESWPGLINSASLLLFRGPRQLTGYWEQGSNDTATQQISTSSASRGFEQIWSLPL